MTTTVAYNSDHALAQAGLLSCDGNLIDRFMRRFAKGVKNITARFGRALSQNRVGYSPENSLSIFIRGGEGNS
jgi:hypothetical protein